MATACPALSVGLPLPGPCPLHLTQLWTLFPTVTVRAQLVHPGEVPFLPEQPAPAQGEVS